MASREELEAREGACTTAGDYATLIKQAAAVDKEYARSLVDKAEMVAQMPPDYVAAAEAAFAIGEEEMARNLFDQAEDMCFEPMEFAVVGTGLAASGLDRKKGAALLQQAAGQATKLEEFLAISRYAKEALGDEELAASLLAKVEERAKGLDDYMELARSVKAAGDEAMARGLFEKAARYLGGVADTVRYAQAMVEVLGDREWARATLEGAEGDCQFPKDFAELAAGFKGLFDAGDKVAALMQQAADFAMSGEENLDLAQGYWDLMGDAERAAAAYEKALPDLNDKARLLELAGLVAGGMGAKDLARRFYAKAEQKMAGAGELLKLAEAVMQDTGDRDYALDIYRRAADSLSQPNDLMNLGGNIVDQLGDKPAAAQAYRKAFEAVTDFGQYLKLLERAHEKLGDPEFCREILTKAAKVATGTPEFLVLADQSMQVLGDGPFARDHLQRAEEQVTSVGEMKNVVAAVRRHFADAADWIAVVEEKLARREANQAKYAAFQQREKGANTVIKRLRLADDVMAELEDRFYAQKLLLEAEKLLAEEGWDLTKARMLIRGASRHLGDAKWTTRLLNEAASRARDFAALRSVAEMALEDMADRDAARSLVRGYFKDWEAGLDAAGASSAYDYAKLAGVAAGLAADPQWAQSLLVEGAALGGDHFAFAELARVACDVGLSKLAEGFMERAAESCSGADRAGQLARRLAETGFEPEQVRAAYAAARAQLRDPRQQLAWAEGLINLFGDREWARQAYDELAADMGQDELYRQSRRLKLEQEL